MTASPPPPTGPSTGAFTGTSPSRIIRRAPTGSFPAAAAPGTGMAPRVAAPAPAETFSPPPAVGHPQPSPAVPVSACVVAVISGWATSVVATDLIASWWRTDRLFCLAVGFLTLIFAAATVTGIVLLLRRRWPGGHLIAVGAVVALLTFGSLFLAGARVPTVVHLIPLLQVASAALALHPASGRWVIR